MPERFEAGSEQWIDALREVVEETLTDVDLTGVQVAFYEECLNPPAHLLADGETTLAWRVEISESGVEVGRGRPVDPDFADFALEADYTALLGIAHLSVSDPELPRIMADLEAKGLLRRLGDGSKMPPQVGAAWANVHDEMAKRTI